MLDVKAAREPQPVECCFYVRTRSEDGKFHYDLLSIKGYAGGGRLVTFHPPEVGDLIPLRDEWDRIPGGTFKVLSRRWLHSSYGSPNWPLGSPSPHQGPLLDLVVEHCEGPFEDESDLRSPYSSDEEG